MNIPEDELEKMEEKYSATCFNCGGKGYTVVCVDDLCRNGDSCFHGDGEEWCKDCEDVE